MIAKAWPAMLRAIWGDDHRYQKQYWGRGAGQLSAEQRPFDEDGYHWIMGRIDDVLNVAGHRMRTAEVEARWLSTRA